MIPFFGICLYPSPKNGTDPHMQGPVLFLREGWCRLQGINFIQDNKPDDCHYRQFRHLP